MCSSHVTVGLGGAVSPDRELHLSPSQPCLGRISKWPGSVSRCSAGDYASLGEANSTQLLLVRSTSVTIIIRERSRLGVVLLCGQFAEAGGWRAPIVSVTPP